MKTNNIIIEDIKTNNIIIEDIKTNIKNSYKRQVLTQPINCQQ